LQHVPQKNRAGGKNHILERRIHNSDEKSDHTARKSMVDFHGYFSSQVYVAYVQPNKNQKNKQKEIKKVPPWQGTQKWTSDLNSPSKIVQDSTCRLSRTRCVNLLKTP
jgi:hypothetical protein